MAEVSIAYLEDGEYLNIATNADRHGSMIGIEPIESREVVATPTDNLAEVAQAYTIYRWAGRGRAQ